MINKMWNAAIAWASSERNTGDWAEHDGRTAEAVDMCGGRFLLTEGGDVCGLVNSPVQVAWFLCSGEIIGQA